MRYPKELNKNMNIGVTATSMGVTDPIRIKRLDRAYKYLCDLGYKIIETDNARKTEGIVSSSGKIRAQEFIELWTNNKISMISQVAGGEFLVEMLPYLDKEKLDLSKIKWVTGYSDSSLLNFYLTTKYDIATVTCDNIQSFGLDKVDDSMTKQLEILNQKESIQKSFKYYEEKSGHNDEDVMKPLNLTEKVEYKSLYEDKKVEIKGRLIGGCIDVLTQVLGTNYDNTLSFIKKYEKDGILWYLENCELSVAELYRRLFQMKQAGWFKSTTGFIIGRTASKEDYFDLTYVDVLHRVFDDLKVDVIYDVDFGHIAPQWTMINGSLSTFTYENKKGKIKQELV